MGGRNSDLGFPISDELTTPDGIGRYSVFEGGMIYWTPQTGAHPVADPVLLDWAAAGYEKALTGTPRETRKTRGYLSPKTLKVAYWSLSSQKSYQVADWSALYHTWSFPVTS